MTSTETAERHRPLPMDPRIWTRRVAVTRANGRKRLRIVLVVLVIGVLGAAGLAALHTSLFSANRLTVEGSTHTAWEEILETAGLSDHPPLIDVNTTADARRVEQLPWVKTASVSVHWPDSATVVVTERTPAAAIELPLTGLAPAEDAKKSSQDEVDGAGRWALVDASGRVLGFASPRPAGIMGVTVDTPPGPPGTVLPVSDQAGIAVASSIPSLLDKRTEAIAVSSSGVSLGLSGGLIAYLGVAVDLPAKYQTLASVLAGARLHAGEWIDVANPGQPTVGPASSAP